MVDSFAAITGIIYRKYNAGLKAYLENISVSKFLSSATQPGPLYMYSTLHQERYVVLYYNYYHV